MNNEIKKILKNIQYAIDEDDYWEVTKKTLKPLLYYITNLQQENEYLKKQNDEKTKIGVADHKYASQMEDKVIELQQENKTLHENNQAMQEEMARVWEENEKLKELCDKYEEEHSNEFKIWKEERHELLDYKSRCEKASDNLKRNYWINEHEHNDDVVNMTLNILQNGSDSQ